MSQIIRISKQGIDVLGTAGTVPNNLISDSDLNTFKILTTGTVSVSYTTDPGEVETFGTFSHGQSGTPLVIAFMKMADNRVSLISQRSTDGNSTWFYSLKIDGTNFYVGGASGSANVTRTVRYYIVEPPL